MRREQYINYIRKILIITLFSFWVFPSLASDPKILKMVFVPASEKGDENDYESLLEIISQNAGIKIESIKVTDYNAAVEAMRAGRAQMAWFGGKTYIVAAKIAGAQAFAAGVRVGSKSAGYYSFFVVRNDSNLKNFNDVKGQILGLGSIGSTSGDLIPRVELSKIGLSIDNPNDFKQFVYTGNHDACLLAVINKHINVCGMSSRNFEARLADGTINKNEVRIIHKSPLVPPPPLAYSKNLSKNLKNKIKKATIEAHKYGKIGGYGGEMSHYIEVKDTDYDTLRQLETLLK